MFFAAILLLRLAALAPGGADEPGFGGAGEPPADERDEQRAEQGQLEDLPPPTEFSGGAAPTPTTTAPVLRVKEPPRKSKLELELEKARIDPAGFPLIQLRVDVARLEVELDDKEDRGLTAARDVEKKLTEARALLADAERIALHRMSVCAARQGKTSSVKNYRMTAAGPVRLTTREILAQTSQLDPDGCARIELLDQALVDRLRRAHDIQLILASVNFPYHRIAERRSLEEELKAIQKALAVEDLPVLTVPGVKDPYGR